MYLILGKKPGIFDVVIVNDNLEAAYDQLKNAVLEVRKELRLFIQRTHPTNWQPLLTFLYKEFLEQVWESGRVSYVLIR